MNTKILSINDDQFKHGQTIIRTRLKPTESQTNCHIIFIYANAKWCCSLLRKHCNIFCKLQGLNMLSETSRRHKHNTQ